MFIDNFSSSLINRVNSQRNNLCLR